MKNKENALSTSNRLEAMCDKQDTDLQKAKKNTGQAHIWKTSMDCKRIYDTQVCIYIQINHSAGMCAGKCEDSGSHF